jgi:hypothetical protein
MTTVVIEMTAEGSSSQSGYTNGDEATFFGGPAFGSINPTAVGTNPVGTIEYNFASSNNSSISLSLEYTGTAPADSYITSVSFVGSTGTYNLGTTGLSTALNTGTSGNKYKHWQWRGSSVLPSQGNPFNLGTIYAITIVYVPPEPVVPNVVGDNVAEATAAFTAAGLTLGSVTNVNNATTDAGLILSQSPAAGTSQPIGTPINLTVSLGPTNPQTIGAIKIDLQVANKICIQFVYSPLGVL